jgi:hypothetical protein
MDNTEPWLAHLRGLAESVGGLPGWRAAPGVPGLGEASAAFARFAEDYGRLTRPAGAAGSAEQHARFHAELRALAERLVGTALPAWAGASGAGPDLRSALEAWSGVLSGIASDTAARFAARLSGPEPPATLRAAFDAWIDCAEDAFQQAAHGETFVTGQARLLNALVAERARQQELVDRGARALGLPTRAEVDGLHDALRDLRMQLAAATPPPDSGRGGRRAPGARRAARKPPP